MYTRVLGIAFSVALGLAVFQNCSQPVSFDAGDSLASQTGELGTPPDDGQNPVITVPVPEKGDLQFDAQTNQTEHLPLVKLIMIVDNSDSMTDYQTLLANGVKSMLDKLKAQKLNIDFHLFTTTATPGGKNSSAESLPIEYLDPAGNVITAAAATGKPHIRDYKYRLAPSLALNGASPLGFRSTMTDAQLTAASDEIQRRIKAIGTTGSSDESGLCSMLRVLKDKDLHKIVSPGDRVAVVVLSDEDDSIKIENCVAESQEIYQAVATETKCSSTTAECKPPYSYWSTYNNTNLLKFSLVYNNPACPLDGGRTAPCAQTKTTAIDCAKSPSLCPTTAPTGVASTCSSAQQQAAATALGINNASISSCSVSHVENLATLKLTNQMDRGLCAKSFTISGVTYANVADYMHKKYPTVAADKWRDPCSEYGLVDVVKKTSTLVKSSLVDTGSTANDQIKSLLTSVFGANAFRLSFVINDAQANVGQTCPAGTENNKGLLYRALGNLLPAQSFVSSICAANYDAAMGDLGKFIESIAARSYQLNISKDQVEIESITILRSGSTINLLKTDYSFTAGHPANLTFREDLLQPGDKITVKWVEIL